MSLPGVSVTLDANVEGFVRGWERAADAAERSAARIKAAAAAADSSAPEAGKWQAFEQELEKLTTAAKNAAEHLKNFGNSNKSASSDVEKLGREAEKAAAAVGKGGGGGGGGLSGALEAGGKGGQLMAVGIALLVSILPALLAAALALSAALMGFGAVALVVAGGMKGIQEASRHLTASLGGLREQLNSIFRSGLNQEFQALGQAIAGLNGPITDIAKSTVGVVTAFTGWIRSAQGMSEIRTMLQGVNQMMQQLAPGAKAVAQAFTAFGAAAGPVLGEIGKALSSVFEKINQVIQKAKETGQLQKAFEAGAKAVSALGTVLAALVKILIQVAADAGGQAADALEKFGQALSDAAPLIGLVFKELALAINIIMVVVEWIAKLAAALAPLYDLMGKVTDAINDFINALSPDKIGEFAKAVGGFFAGMGQAIAQFASDSKKNIDKWKDDTNKSINTGLDSAKQSVDKWKDSTNQSINQWVEGWKQKLGKWKDDTNQSINTGLDSAKQAIDKWKDQTNQDINKFVGEWLDAIGKWWDDTVKAVVDGISKVIDEIKQIPQKALDALNQWVSDMEQIGKDAIDGIAKGIEAAVSNLVGAATRAAQAAMDAIKGVLGIASPSIRLRNEVGLMMGAGMSEGILASAGMVTDAMNRTALAAVAAGRGAAGLSATGMARATGGQAMTLSVSGGADTAVGTMIARLAQQGKLKISANAIVR